VERATGRFEEMIADQKAAGLIGGDHFAVLGINDRVCQADVAWQALCEDWPVGTLDAALDAGAERRARGA
jgi:hypothetical protein